MQSSLPFDWSEVLTLIDEQVRVIQLITALNELSTPPASPIRAEVCAPTAGVKGFGGDLFGEDPLQDQMSHSARLDRLVP